MRSAEFRRNDDPIGDSPISSGSKPRPRLIFRSAARSPTLPSRLHGSDDRSPGFPHCRLIRSGVASPQHYGPTASIPAVSTGQMAPAQASTSWNPARRHAQLVSSTIGASSAVATINPDMFPYDSLDHARALHLTGITPALSPGCAGICSVSLSGRERGIPLIFDVNYRALLWSPEDAALGLTTSSTTSNYSSVGGAMPRRSGRSTAPRKTSRAPCSTDRALTLSSSPTAELARPQPLDRVKSSPRELLRSTSSIPLEPVTGSRLGS